MRPATAEEKIESRVCDHAWAWVHDTCRAIVAFNAGVDDPRLVLEAYDELSARIEAQGMTGTALIECTIRWAHERIERSGS